MNYIRVTSVAEGRGKVRVVRHTQPWSWSGGFTLIELLVVIVVMLILITMTVSAVDFGFTQERVKAAARQVQSALAGARDRAIFAKNETRGLRFLTDETDPRMVTSMIYIRGEEDWAQGSISLEYVDDNNDQVPDNVIDTNNDGTLEPAIKIVRGSGCNWYTLKERGLLGVFEDRNFNGVLDGGEDQNGNNRLDLDAPRIEIPQGSKNWYPVLTHRLTPVNEVLELLVPYQGQSQPTGVQVAAGIRYGLELQPRVLPEAQPIVLPESVCIDLDGSLVPASWRPGAGSGVAGPYSSHMDIMFSPRGVVTGPLAAAGLIHLYVAERKDVPNTISLLARPWINSNSAGPLVPGENQFREDANENGVLDAGEDLNGNGQVDEATPVGQRAIVSIFTQTGKVSSYQIDATDIFINATGTSGRDGYADSPFRNVHSEVTNP